jgi:hypothetical protein
VAKALFSVEQRTAKYRQIHRDVQLVIADLKMRELEKQEKPSEQEEA